MLRLATLCTHILTYRVCTNLVDIGNALILCYLLTSQCPIELVFYASALVLIYCIWWISLWFCRLSIVLVASLKAQNKMYRMRECCKSSYSLVEELLLDVIYHRRQCILISTIFLVSLIISIKKEMMPIGSEILEEKFN